MRTDRYRFTKYFDPQKLKIPMDLKTGIYELYDHQTDPDENFNIAYEAENVVLVKKSERKMDESGYLKIE